MSRNLAYAEIMRHLGLGNRVRALLGVSALAKSENREFCYSWPTGKWFGASMSELWDFEATMVNGVSARWLALRHRARDGSLAWLDDHSRNESVWRIRTGHALPVPQWHDGLRGLRPAEDLATRITTFFSRHLAGEQFVGVMIRAHAVSHQQTRDQSPIEWYVQRMTDLRAQQPGIRFFISCDVESVANRLVDQFGNCITLADKGEYNSRQALLASVCDLYLLACSGFILAPHYSSFPELAKILGGAHVALETSSTSPATLDPSLAEDPLRPWDRDSHTS